jgi:hypothetical protein
MQAHHHPKALDWVQYDSTQSKADGHFAPHLPLDRNPPAIDRTTIHMHPLKIDLGQCDPLPVPTPTNHYCSYRPRPDETKLQYPIRIL